MALTFCDVSTFYCDRGGGIRTYHRAKLNWFAAQSRHRYVLVFPGRRFRVTRMAAAVHGIEVYGPRTGHGRDGYRLMLDYWRVVRVLRAVCPDVVETGDPWISGPFALLARRNGHVPGLLTSFCHTDPVDAYLRPWTRRHALADDPRERLLTRADRWFGMVQRKYDWSLIASRTMFDRLRSLGVHRLIRAPFGVDPMFMETPPRPRRPGDPLRVLYAGRLQVEKGFDLVLDALPAVARIPGVTITVAGAGPMAAALAKVPRSLVTRAGYVGDRREMKRLFDAHDVLLSPGPHETFGLAALEAMATGMVVVGADSGGTGELLRRIDSPFGFDPGDRAGLVDAVRRAASHDLGPWADRGRELARGFGTWHAAVGRLVARYERLVDGGASA